MRTRSSRLCCCGCGQPAAEAYDKSGVFKGYYKYAKECVKKARQRAGSGEGPKKGLETSRLSRTLPVGTRRQTNHANPRYKGQKSFLYWEVKIALPSVWVAEHRWLMEQALGRPLLSTEHVHHIDGDGLNNSIENLQLMTQREHLSHTARHSGLGHWDRSQPHTCPCCGKWHDPRLL